MTALRCNCNWILYDDGRAPRVASGVLAALRDFHNETYPRRFHWTYFEYSWNGTILIHNRDAKL